MRFLVTPLCLLLSVMIAAVASADDDAAENQDRNDRRAAMRERILAEFDADGDGEMSEAERATAREQMRKRRGDRANQGPRLKGEGKPKSRAKAKAETKREGKPMGEARSKRQGQGRRRGGPAGAPDPGKLFDKFDANGDGQLSRAEFMKLTEEVRANRAQRGGADRDVARPRRPARPEGPPQEARRRFDRVRSLQNPGERAGPPRPEGRRRLNDEDGPRGRAWGEQGARGRRGPGGPGGRGGPGAEGSRPPAPDAMFDRFDENGDDQLSREEFMKLAERMHQRRERMGPGGDGAGMREGRGPRRGRPDEEGSSRRPRRPRQESDARPQRPASDDNSV